MTSVYNYHTTSQLHRLVGHSYLYNLFEKLIKDVLVNN